MLGFAPLAAGPLSATVQDQALPELFGAASGTLTLSGAPVGANASAADAGGGIALGGVLSGAVAALMHAEGTVALFGTVSGAARAQAETHRDLGLAGDSAGAAFAKAGAQSAFVLQGAARAPVSLQASATGGMLVSTQTDAGVDVDAAGARAIGLTGSASAHVASTAGISGTADLGGLAGLVTHTEATAQSVLGLQGHSRGALASSARTDGHLRVVSIIHAAASGAGNAAGEIGVSGSAAALTAVAMAFDATVTPAGVARSTIAITAAGQSAATIQHVARADTGAASAAQSDLAISGLAFGVSLPPLFAQAACAVVIGGSAKLDAAVSGTAGNSLDLVGASDAGGPVSGAGVSTVNLALNFAGDAALPAKAGSAVSVNGDASASVGQTVVTADVLSLDGTSSVGLPILATVEGEFTVESYTAGFCGITFSAQGKITVTRTLVTDVSIFADATRAVDLNGQGAAIVVSGVTSAIASITVSGTTTAAALALGDAATTLGLSGKVTAEVFTASDLSGAFEVGLTASVTAPRLAAFGAVLAVSGSAGAVSNVASTAFGDLAPAGTAFAAVSLQAEASTAMAFTRDAAAVALIDATSARAIAFGLNAVGQVDLAAGFVGQAPLHLASGAALTTRAETAEALDFAVVASAQGDVKALGALSVDVAGASMSLATASSGSLGEFTVASAGEADAAVIGNSARSLPLIGDTTATVQLTADAVGGTFDLGLIVAAVGDARADASGAISLTGIGRSNITTRAKADSVFAVRRFGAGDVSVVGQSARVVTFLGQASVSTASAAAANTKMQIATSVAAQTALRAALERVAVNSFGESAAMTIVAGSASTAFWPVAGASVAFRAPPSVRRRAFASTDQGGRLLPSRRSAAA
jgi:hypothetical protein